MKERILALREQGKSYREIQEELGCSKGTIAYHCGAGQKDKTLSRQHDRRSQITKFIQEYKQSVGCKDCGENYPFFLLDFDHLDDKEFDVSSYRTKTLSLEKVKAEIAKCDVVCANCHRSRTYYRALKRLDNTMDIDKHYNV